MKPLIILGTADSKSKAPWGDPAVEFWAVHTALSHPGIDAKQIHTIFEMHPRRYWGQPEVLARLNAFEGPVWMQDHYDEVPSSRRYPLERVREAFHIDGMGETLYITNTISYMLALAYLEGYEDIRLYGVAMSHHTEYGYQKPNCEYYLGFLHAKGVRLHVEPGGDLLKAPYLYGYGEPTQTLGKLQSDLKGLEVGLSEIEGERTDAERRYWKQQGAIRLAKNLLHEFGGY